MLPYTRCVFVVQTATTRLSDVEILAMDLLWSHSSLSSVFSHSVDNIRSSPLNDGSYHHKHHSAENGPIHQLTLLVRECVCNGETVTNTKPYHPPPHHLPPGLCNINCAIHNVVMPPTGMEHGSGVGHVSLCVEPLVFAIIWGTWCLG